MSTLNELEQNLKKANEISVEAEDNRKRYFSGLPTLNHLAIKKALEQNLKDYNKLMETIKQLEKGYLKKLEFQVDLTKIKEAMGDITVHVQDTLNTLNDTLLDFSRKFDSEIAKQDRQRELEKEIIGKLTVYLDKWK